MRLVEPIDLIARAVQRLYSAENQLILALPRIAARVTSPDLHDALEQHLLQSREHPTRLEAAARALDIPCAGIKCHAMEGLLRDGDELLGCGGDPTRIDTAIIATCQSVEQYEIAQYQFLHDLLNAASFSNVVRMIEPTRTSELDASTTLEELLETMFSDSAPVRTVQ